jgi:hypothetical protein
VSGALMGPASAMGVSLAVALGIGSGSDEALVVALGAALLSGPVELELPLGIADALADEEAVVPEVAWLGAAADCDAAGVELAALDAEALVPELTLAGSPRLAASKSCRGLQATPPARAISSEWKGSELRQNMNASELPHQRRGAAHVQLEAARHGDMWGGARVRRDEQPHSRSNEAGDPDTKRDVREQVTLRHAVDAGP